MVRSRRWASLAVLSLLAAALLVVVTHAAWLGWMGRYLVASDEPFQADAIVVLAGGTTGNRILKAAELAQAGFARQVLVNGPAEMYGVNEADLAIDYAVSEGCPRDLFLPVKMQARSTAEEARAMEPVLRSRNLRRLLIVTSSFHTRRAGRTLRRILGPDFEIRMIAAPDRYFRADGWWKLRESRKTFLLEATKTLASFAGM